jgi:hypothetical protein
MAAGRTADARSRVMNVGHRVARWPDRDRSKILPARRPRADADADADARTPGRPAHGTRHCRGRRARETSTTGPAQGVAKGEEGRRGEEGRAAVCCSGPWRDWRWRRHKTRSTYGRGDATTDGTGTYASGSRGPHSPGRDFLS